MYSQHYADKNNNREDHVNKPEIRHYYRSALMDARRWQGVLTDDQVKAYDELALAELGPELARWLEFGGRLD